MDFHNDRSPSADESPPPRYSPIGGKGAKGPGAAAAADPLHGEWSRGEAEGPRPGCKDNLVPTEVPLERAGISRAHFYALRKAGKAPRPIKLSPGRRGAVRYVESEVDAWVASLIASRDELKPSSADGEAEHG